jgi:hypothetical protein
VYVAQVYHIKYNSTVPITYEVLEGIVQQASAKDDGFKIVDRWVNYDLRAVVRHPKPGERVKLRIRNGRFVIHLVAPDQELPPEPQPARGGGAWRSPEEERRIVRQAMLKASVEWLSTFADDERRPTSDDVLKLAERFEAWIYR